MEGQSSQLTQTNKNFVDEVLGQLPPSSLLESVAANSRVISTLQFHREVDIVRSRKYSLFQRYKQSWKNAKSKLLGKRAIIGVQQSEADNATVEPEIVIDVIAVRSAENVVNVETTSIETHPVEQNCSQNSLETGVETEIPKSFGRKLKTGSQEIAKKFSKLAGDSAIPVLEDAGAGTWFDKVWAVASFAICIASVLSLCHFLDVQTKGNPISDGVQGVPIHRGPLPTIGIASGSMLKQAFVLEAEMILDAREGEVEKVKKTQCGPLDMKEKTVFAIILGQIAALGYKGDDTKALVTAQKYLRKINTTQLNVPNDPNNAGVQKAVCIIKKGMIGCSELIKNCTTHSPQRNNCSTMFAMHLTGKGLMCLFNYIPYSLTERNTTLRGLFSKSPPEYWSKYLTQIDFNKLSFSEEYAGYFVMHGQEVGGDNNGLSFTVVRPDESTGSKAFSLITTAPLEPITIRQRNDELEYGKKYLLSLGVSSQYCSSDIRHVPFKSGRDCLFYSEGVTGNYLGYTYHRCLETLGAKTRECSLIFDCVNCVKSREEWNALDLFENSDKPLCQPETMMADYHKADEEYYLISGKYFCPKSCNDVVYRYHTKTFDVQNNSSASGATTTVHVYFNEDEVEVRVKSLRRFIAEEIGIILGMLGFCNDITMPKILRFVGKHGVVVLRWMWRKISEIRTN